MTLAAVIYNRLTGHSYPHHALPVGVRPAQTGGYSPEDLDAVLDEWDEVLSVDRDDLDALFRALESRVQTRDRGSRVSP